MQNMILIEPRNVLLSHCISIPFYTLHDFDIIFNCSETLMITFKLTWCW